MVRCFRAGVPGALALALALAPAQPARAQLPSASSAALGFADSYTGAARGYDAIALNPANLALSGNPDGSLAFFPVRAFTGLGPVTLSEVAEYGGKMLPENVRSTWLQRIQSAPAGEQGDLGVDLTYAAVQVGRVGFQLSSTAHGLTTLNGDAAQLILFGNARNGQPQALTLGDSHINGEATSTAAFSYAHPFAVGQTGARVAVGGALKFTLGHVLAYGRDAGSHTSNVPLELQVRFPVVLPDTGSYFNNGGGVGLDLGGAYEAGRLTLSAALQNVFNTFGWNTSKLRFRSAEAIWTADSVTATTATDQPFVNAPTALQQQVEGLSYKPVVRLGAAYRLRPRLVIDADVHHRFGDGGMQFDPQTHVGVGAQYRVLSFVPVRAGAAVLTGGSQFGGGLGLELGTFTMGGALVHRHMDGRGSTISMITLISSFPRLTK
jgi:hypothetical protein